MIFIFLIAYEYRNFYDLLYRNYKKTLWVYAKSLTHRDDLADEAVQNAFVQLLKQSRRFDPSKTEAIKAYAIVTTRHEAYKILKRESKGATLVDDTIDVNCLSDQGQSSQPFTCHVDNLQEICSAIAILNQVEKDVIYLRFREDMKASDVAKILHLSTTNVSTIQSRATKKLRDYIQKVDGHAKG